MNRLLEEINADPDATFQIEIDMPGGNQLRGTIGPMVGRRLCCSINFLRDPTDDEVLQAQELMNKIMGQKPEFQAVSRSPEERKESLNFAHKFLRKGLQ